MDVGGLPVVLAQVEGINGDEITFEGTVDGGTWYAIPATNVTDGATSTLATADGVYLISVGGLSQVRARVSTYSAGTITVTGKGIVNAMSPVAAVSAVSRAAISAAGSGDNTLVAAAAGKKIKVLGLFMVAAGDVDVRLESGAGGAALTGVISLPADGNGFVLDIAPAGYHWMETAASALLNLELSDAVQVSGAIVYRVE